jgi:hypothetical protein
VSDGNIPYATALAFGRYLQRAPLDKAPFVDELRRSHQTRRGFNPYSKFCAACRADLRFGTPGRQLAEAVRSVQPRYRPLYQQLSAGYTTYLTGLPDTSSCSEQKIHNAVVVRAGLTLNLNPHLGLRRGDGTIEATYLWFDPIPPQPENAAVLLRLMEQHMDVIHPMAIPVVLDVRRGHAHRTISVSTTRIDRYIDGQAAAFVINWAATA